MRTFLAADAVRADNTTVNLQKLQYLIDPGKKSDVPQLEIFLSDGYSGLVGFPTNRTTPAYNDGFFTLFASLLHLYSHGSVHITSDNISTDPRIDPRYLSNSYDMKAVLSAAKYLRQIATTLPLDSFWVSEYEPGMQVQTDGDWKYYVRNSSLSIYHPSGTCAILPLEKGGVVDAELKVYGIDNLRVVDASVIPVLPSAHIQTAVYGIAEYAARLVAQAWENERSGKH